MLKPISTTFFFATVLGQQQCYFAAGGQYRGPDNLVPCNSTGASSCCLLGDTCLSGNTCYNPATGNLYQYGCTDITYTDETCPYKCGFDPDKSPWTALEYCNDVQDLENTWICHGPESCGCQWTPSEGMLVLQPRGCKDMGSDALVALYAPEKLAPYVSLPSSAGGSTGYYSPTISAGSSTWVETAIPGYTPSDFTQLTTYRAAPTTSVWVEANVTPGPSTYASAKSWTGSAPTISNGGGGATSAAATTTDEPSLATETSSSSSSGLSTSAKAGIGVGVAGGALLLAGLGICIYCLGRRRSTRQRQQPPLPPQYPQSPQQQPHMQMPPYPPPQMQGINWAPIQPGAPLMDPAAYGYPPSAASPHSEVSRSVSRGKPSYGHAPSPPPMELSAEAVRRSLYEMEVGDGEERRKREGMGMGNAF